MGQNVKNKAVVKLHAKSGRSNPIQPERLIRGALVHARDREKLTEIFTIWPNCRDVTKRLAVYLANLPRRHGYGALFHQCIHSAKRKSSDSQGRNNFGERPDETLVLQNYLAGLLIPIPDVLWWDVIVTTNRGIYQWDPFKENLSDFWNHYGTKPKWRKRKTPIHHVNDATFRKCVASKILRGSDIVSIGRGLEELM